MGRTDKQTIRTFICVEVPSTIRERLAELQASLKRVGAEVSWVRPSSIHLTVKFLGDVPTRRIDAISQSVERAAAGIGGFDLEVAGVGCFPSVRRPRVLWVGLPTVPSRLKDLHSAIEAELEIEGFERDRRSFSPHLTIGRIRGERNASRVAEELIRIGFEPERFVVREVIVMRSELKPTGSVYTPLAVVELKE